LAEPVALEDEAALGCSLLGLAEGRVSGMAWDVWMLKASPATPSVSLLWRVAGGVCVLMLGL
jgi:hypothetical protein